MQGDQRRRPRPDMVHIALSGLCPVTAEPQMNLGMDLLQPSAASHSGCPDQAIAALFRQWQSPREDGVPHPGSLPRLLEPLHSYFDLTQKVTPVTKRKDWDALWGSLMTPRVSVALDITAVAHVCSIFR